MNVLSTLKEDFKSTSTGTVENQITVVETKPVLSYIQTPRNGMTQAVPLAMISFVN